MGLKHRFVPQRFSGATWRNGSKAAFPTQSSDVRFTPESDRLLRCREMTLCVDFVQNR